MVDVLRTEKQDEMMGLLEVGREKIRQVKELGERLPNDRVSDEKDLASHLNEAWSATMRGLVPKPVMESLITKDTSDSWRSNVSFSLSPQGVVSQRQYGRREVVSLRQFIEALSYSKEDKKVVVSSVLVAFEAHLEASSYRSKASSIARVRKMREFLVEYFDLVERAFQPVADEVVVRMGYELPERDKVVSEERGGCLVVKSYESRFTTRDVDGARVTARYYGHGFDDQVLSEKDFQSCWMAMGIDVERVRAAVDAKLVEVAEREARKKVFADVVTKRFASELLSARVKNASKGGEV